jgi:hypothetical protein
MFSLQISFDGLDSGAFFFASSATRTIYAMSTLNETFEVDWKVTAPSTAGCDFQWGSGKDVLIQERDLDKMEWMAKETCSVRFHSLIREFVLTFLSSQTGTRTRKFIVDPVLFELAPAKVADDEVAPEAVALVSSVRLDSVSHLSYDKTDPTPLIDRLHLDRQPFRDRTRRTDGFRLGELFPFYLSFFTKR